MADTQSPQVKSGLDLGASTPNLEMSWRRTLAGIGVFLLFVSLFAAAGAKGALGRLPLYVSILALLLLAIAAVAGMLNRGSKKP